MINVSHNNKNQKLQQKMQQNILSLPEICEHLLNNSSFVSGLRIKLKQSQSISMRQQQFDLIIEQLSELINLLIHQKLQKQMSDLIADNNSILEGIKKSLEKNGSEVSGDNRGSKDSSFTEIHNLIHEQKKKMLQQLNQAQVQKSTSLLGQYDDYVEKVNQLQKKVKAIEQKYETNFKSLWNVLSMTQSAVFDFIKQNRSKQQKEKIREPEVSTEKKQSLFSFWK